MTSPPGMQISWRYFQGHSLLFCVWHNGSHIWWKCVLYSSHLMCYSLFLHFVTGFSFNVFFPPFTLFFSLPLPHSLLSPLPLPSSPCFPLPIPLSSFLPPSLPLFLPPSLPLPLYLSAQQEYMKTCHQKPFSFYLLPGWPRHTVRVDPGCKLPWHQGLVGCDMQDRSQYDQGKDAWWDPQDL